MVFGAECHVPAGRSDLIVCSKPVSGSAQLPRSATLWERQRPYFIQRTPDQLTLQIGANAESGFNDTEVGVVRDNARTIEIQRWIDRGR